MCEKDHGLRCTEKTGNEETDRRKEKVHGTVEERQKSGRLSGAVFHGQKVQKERKECECIKEKHKKKNTKATVKKLKNGKTYRVRMHSYKKINGKKYYSGWGKVKSVKVK